jgi:hypothetical protein
VRRLRRRCERRLSGVPIPHPFDLTEFCARVAHLRGRRLTVQAVPALNSAAPCGLWISMPGADYILYDPDTSRLHAEHIVLHELGHMLCGHTIAAGVRNSTIARLLPDIDPRTVARVLGRACYSNAQEQEAEMLASVIWARAARGPAGTPAGTRGDALGRLADVLVFET